MSEDDRSCPSCGAHVPPDVAACTLCGTPVEDDIEESGDDPTPSDAPADSESNGTSASSEEAVEGSVFCHECGLENPPGANYCSQCGTELRDVSEIKAPDGTRPVTADLPDGASSPASKEDETADADDEQAEMGRQILTVVGTALVLVLGLFFLTQWSQQYEWGSGDESSSETATAEQQASESGPNGASSPTGPSGGPNGTPSSPQAAAASAPTDLSALVDKFGGSVEGAVAGRIDSVRTALEGAEGDERRTLRRQLANLYVGAGTPGRAALVQSQVADETGRTEDRRRAGDLLYKWMRQVEQQQGRAQVSEVARHVAEAYATVVEERPQDLDARTRMGEAYLLTNNPMKGIEAINQVLEDDSTFVPARFQKGLALLQINRLDQAVTQFEKVMTFASQDDPFYQQAKRAIEVIRKQAQSSSGQGTSTDA